jgi:hypothetical protein
MNENPTYTAFAGQTMIASGPLSQVIPALKCASEQAENGPVLVFEDHTGRQVDFDLRGSADEALARALPPQRTGPGRPKLGVVGREISLLPRHWEWLEEQPNGASAALRRLVDQARTQDQASNRVRLAVEAAGRFMSAIAGNFTGYEEATRALYARDRSRLEELTASWPQDVRQHMLRLLGDCI